MENSISTKSSRSPKRLIVSLILTIFFIGLVPNTAEARRFWGWEFNNDDGRCKKYILWIKVRDVECDG